MDSHQSHQHAQHSDHGVDEVSRCQICHEPIWGNQWPTFKEKVMRQFVCFYCFSKLKDCDYTPPAIKKSNLFVCDMCGEVVGKVEETDTGFLCKDCKE